MARQGWRLISDPESLCAQVLCAKYFPDGNVLAATEQPGISYSWRSIVRGLDALKKGLIWRVGSGEKINIWLDPWIPNAATRRPVTPRGQNVLTRVSDLIDPTTGVWDEVLVRDIFWEMDADLILTIPVKTEYEDCLAWHYDAKGIFTVKSAYHVMTDEQDRSMKKQTGESSNGSGHDQFRWSSIWSLKCQPKVAQFLWRLAHNSLPLRRNIKHRGMDADTICPMCNRLDEDGGHLFLKCKAVKQCWRMMNMEHIRCRLAEGKTGAEVVRMIVDLKTPTRAEVTSLLWTWWDTRNKVNAGEGGCSTGDVFTELTAWHSMM